MPRRYEIEGAFRDAVRKEANGRRTVTTVDFVEKLAAVNWHWSLKEANNWIECYITTFKDISDQEGEERTFMLYNPNNGGIEMGFVSPAQDYVESRISLDQQFIVHPSETYFMRAATTYIRAGIAQGALLIVDASVNPCDGSVVVCSLGGEFQLRRYRLSPYAHFEHLSGDGRKDKIDHEWVDENDGIFGVVTHVVNDMRTMEFDDCPVI